MKTLFATVALGAALAGCAGMFEETPYPDAVQVARLDGTTLRVAGEVNKRTSDARVQDYVLLRAAEETLAAGYGHFRILEQRDSSRLITTYTPGYCYYEYDDDEDDDETTSSTCYPGETSTTRLPGSTLVARMYKGPKPPDATGSVYDAAEVVRFVGPQVKGIEHTSGPRGKHHWWSYISELMK